MSYLKHELGDVIVRMLRVQSAGAACREKKALYFSLVTAWHAEAGQVEALLALREHLRSGMNESAGGSILADSSIDELHGIESGSEQIQSTKVPVDAGGFSAAEHIPSGVDVSAVH